MKDSEDSKIELNSEKDFHTNSLAPTESGMDTREWIPALNRRNLTPSEFWNQVFNEEVDRLKNYYTKNIRDPINKTLSEYDRIEDQVLKVGHTALDIVTEDDPYLVAQSRKAFFGFSVEVYHLAKEVIIGAWKLIQFAIEITYDPTLQEKVKTTLSNFESFISKLAGTPAERQDALLRLRNLTTVLSQALVEHFNSEWEKAKQEGTQAELIGKWIADGVFIVGSVKGTFPGAKLSAEAQGAAAGTTLVVTEKAGTQLAEKLAKITTEVNQTVNRSTKSFSKQLTDRVSKRGSSHKPKIGKPKVSNQIALAEERRIKVVAAAAKYGIHTEEGIEVYSKLHDAIEALPQVMKKSNKLRAFKALRIKRIRIGNDPNKVAIIGRVMGKTDGSDIGVYAVKEHFRKLGIEVKTFQMRNEIWDEFMEDVQKFRKMTKNPYAMLPPESVKQTKAFEANRVWAKLLKRYNYTILDIGDPIGKNEYSVFYSIEKKTFFRK